MHIQKLSLDKNRFLTSFSSQESGIVGPAIFVFNVHAATAHRSREGRFQKLANRGNQQGK